MRLTPFGGQDRRATLAAALFGVATFLAIFYWFARQLPGPIAYSEFKALVKSGKVSNVQIDDTRIDGSLDLRGTEAILAPDELQSLRRRFGRMTNVPFGVNRAPDPDLTHDLQQYAVRYSQRASNSWLSTAVSWIAPVIFLVLLSSLWSRRAGAAGGLIGIGKSNARVYVQRSLSVKFSDVEGIDEAKAELIEVVDFLKNPGRYRALGGRIPKGVLIVGAPGTGKTLLAKAVAGEADVPFLSMSGSEFVEMFVGVGAARVRDLFQQAEQLAPCIIFIDELDALGKTRSVAGWSGHEEREQTLNQLLVEMDGFDTNKGVIIMAATNRAEILDPALLRPGRFDRHVAIDRPDVKGREKILALHAKHLKLGPDVRLDLIAAETPGCAGADLANIVNEAALHAARENKSAVNLADFEYAVERMLTGLEKRSRIMNPRERETVAFHEAGHAIVAEARPGADRVAKVSIIPRGFGALGFTQQVPTEERYLLKHSELLDRLDVLLAGRAAEALRFRELSTGAQDDLQRATDLARHMVAQYGMSDALGPLVVEVRSKPLYLPDKMVPSAECGAATVDRIDAEVSRILHSAEERVRRTLTERYEQLDALAKLLLKVETIQRTDLVKILAQSAPAVLQQAG